jgi:glutaredoxin
MGSRITLYTRAGCCLCEEAKQEIEQARRCLPFDLEIVDIDSDPQIRARYQYDIPVILINGEQAFRYRVKAADLIERLRGLS